MRSIAIVQTDDRNVNQLQQNLKQALDPFLKAALLQGYILSDVALSSGDNIIRHGLDRKLQGYITVLANAAATIYDKQSENTSPETTLILNASAPVTVSLYVF